MKLQRIRSEIRKHASPKRAEITRRFFKTAPGSYGEGDRFLGVTVPVLRKLARGLLDTDFKILEKLLASPFHEERALALFVLVLKYEKAGEREREKIYRFYVRNMKGINSWDLVDSSAPHVPGRHLFPREKTPLYRWARSSDLWVRRIAIVATHWFVRKGEFKDSLAIAELLLPDREDLIQKAVGWTLREIGKRDRKAEEAFLQEHYKEMGRTALRYAIERFPEKKRKAYLRGTV